MIIFRNFLREGFKNCFQKKESVDDFIKLSLVLSDITNCAKNKIESLTFLLVSSKNRITKKSRMM